MAEIRGAGDACREAAHGYHSTPAGQLLEEPAGGLDLAPGRAPVREGRPWMGRDDVPAERVELELGEHTAHDRGGGFRRPAPGQLPLGRERDAGDPGAAIARRFADQQQPYSGPGIEILDQARAAKLGARSLPVEVECPSDLCRGEPR